jgi:hypothetical protein
VDVVDPSHAIDCERFVKELDGIGWQSALGRIASLAARFRQPFHSEMSTSGFRQEFERLQPNLRREVLEYGVARYSKSSWMKKLVIDFDRFLADIKMVASTVTSDQVQ